MENSNEIDKSFRDKIIEVIKDHARCSSEKVVSCVRIKWNPSGYDLSVGGYSIEYKAKPKRR